MIGIVVVSHSPALAGAAVDLAAQMVPGDGPVVAVAAGAAGGFGTDAVQVTAALAEAASPDGVLVLMDLGSAVLSAELALELTPAQGYAVRLSPAPLVEGLVAAVVRAAGGADLDTVAREAEAALAPKASALADHLFDQQPEGGQARPDHHPRPDASARLRLVNPQGLHARPAAQIATAVGGLAAEVSVEAGGQRADAASSLELLTLGAGQGAEITVSAVGADAERAVRSVADLVAAGFGELDAS
jgi:phosphoenolpyruvate---glycerone phosphotransferase subunit DhaM